MFAAHQRMNAFFRECCRMTLNKEAKREGTNGKK